MNPSAENSSSVRYCYPGSSASYGYLGTSVNASTEKVLSVGHELEYSNPGSSTPFVHHGLSPSIAPPQSPAISEHLESSASIVRPGSSASIARPGSSASIVRPGSSASIVRPGSSASIVRPGSSASIVRPGSSASIVQPESLASIDRPGPSGSIYCPGSSTVDSGFSGEQSPSFATNGSYAHHSQTENYRHLSQFGHHVLPSPSVTRGHAFESTGRTSQRSETSDISRSVGLPANGFPTRAHSGNQGTSDNGVFVGLSTRPVGSKFCLPHQFNVYLNYDFLTDSPQADIMVRVVQSLERIAEQQRVQDARLIAIDRRLDNFHQSQQQLPSSNDPVTEISGLPVKTLDDLLAFEERLKINETYFELVSIILYWIVIKAI